MSHLQLGGEKCFLFTSKLANQGVRKRYLLVWYLLILMTLHMPMFVEPCYLLCYISIHPLVVQSGLVWSSISSTTLLPFPAQCIWHLTILYSWGLYLISSRRKPGCQSCNHVTQPAAKVRKKYVYSVKKGTKRDGFKQ